MPDNNTTKEKVFAMDEMHLGMQFKYQDTLIAKEHERNYREWADANPDRHNKEDDA